MLLNKIFNYKLKQTEFVSSVMKTLNDGEESTLTLKNMSNEEKARILKYTICKSYGRTNWRPFYVLNLIKLTPKLIAAYEEFRSDPNHQLNKPEFNAVIEDFEVNDFKQKFNTTKGASSRLFLSSYRDIVLRAATEFRKICRKSPYSKPDNITELSIWAKPVITEELIK